LYSHDQKCHSDACVPQEWLKRAKLALEKGDEEAARAALEKKNQQQEIAKNLQNQIQVQDAVSMPKNMRHGADDAHGHGPACCR
jgi:phage shock protein A